MRLSQEPRSAFQRQSRQVIGGGCLTCWAQYTNHPLIPYDVKVGNLWIQRVIFKLFFRNKKHFHQRECSNNFL